MRMPIFIAAPYAGDTATNTNRACSLGEAATRLGHAPFVVHPSVDAGVYGDDADPNDREGGIECSTTFAALIGERCGRCWVIARDDGSLSSGTARDVLAFSAAYVERRTQLLANNPDLVQNNLIPSVQEAIEIRTWDAWSAWIEQALARHAERAARGGFEPPSPAAVEAMARASGLVP